MFVRDIMTRDPVTASPDQTVGEALRKMRKANAGRIPIVAHGALVGIVTRNDVTRALGRPDSENIPLDVLMSRNPVTLASNETLERAASILLDNRVSGLPVVDGGRLVGIVTRSDLLLAFAKMLGFGNNGVRISMQFEALDVLEELSRRLRAWNVESLVTMHDPVTRTWSVVAKVRGRRGLLKFQPARARLPVRPSAQ
jgi:acetoin utilization protein AcuB